MQKNSKPVEDEINLFELLLNLWENRLTIIIITCISIALASLYAFTAKEHWTSEAEIIPPSGIKLGTYLELKRGYSRYTGEGEVNIGEISNYAYKTLILMLNSPDNKLAYLRNTDYFKQLVAELDDELEKQKLLIKMAEKDLGFEVIDRATGNFFSINFVAETASGAQTTLQSYIENINQLVLNTLFDDLRLMINERINSMENDARNIKQQTEQVKKNYIRELNQAIVAAINANILEYEGGSTVEGNMIIDFSNSGSMFLLGEKYLTAQLKSLESSPIIYPVSYYQTLANISGLKQLLKFEPHGMAFDYIRMPSLPLEKDKPKKGLILILGALLGGFLGCGIILVRFVINNGRKC